MLRNPGYNINENNSNAIKESSLSPNLSNTKWTIGIIDEWNFQAIQNFITSESIEKIFQLFLTNGDLNVKRCDRVTVFMPTALPNDIKFRTNLDNRFVFCSAEMNINDAEKIQKNFVLSLLLSIFPKVPNISVAFYYYDGKFLELGIYLTGVPSVEVPVDRNIYRWPEDLALPLGHKLKQIILQNCLSCQNVDVTVTNAIPSSSLKYTDEMYEYQKSKRIFLTC